MTVWLDLIATPNNRLGILEQYGNTVTPDVVRKVVKYIAKKYDPRVCSSRKKGSKIAGRYGSTRASRHYFSQYAFKFNATQSEIYQENTE